MQTVVVLGASPKPGRFAHKALLKLKKSGYKILPVHPKAEEIEGVAVYASLQEIDQPVDTITLYVGPARLKPLAEDIIGLNPVRVIFNPGTESDDIEQMFEAAGITCIKDCTLVMLDQKRF